MADLQLKVYQISVLELKKILKKFPTFASAELSELAKAQGAHMDSETGNGWYFTRNKSDRSWVMFVGFYGGIVAYNGACPDTGLRVGMRIRYDTSSGVYSTLHEVKRKGYVLDPETKTRKKMCCKAPAFNFGGNEYLWLNREECEAKEEKTMELVSVKLLCKALPFTNNNAECDYFNATELHTQGYEIATKDCSFNEKLLIVPVVMSSCDNYEKASPVLEFSKNK